MEYREEQACKLPIMKNDFPLILPEREYREDEMSLHCKEGSDNIKEKNESENDNTR